MLLELPNGINLEAEIFGERADEATLLVPGAGAPMQFWTDEFCHGLSAEGRCVIRYCHRDTGLSDHFDKPYDIGVLLDDLFALLDALDIRRVALIGHSLGGYLSLLSGLRDPDRVRRVVAMSCGPTVEVDRYAEFEMTVPSPETWETLMENRPSGEFDDDIAGWLASWRFLNGTRPFDRQMAVEYTRTLYRGDKRNAQVAENHIHAMTTLPTDLPERLLDRSFELSIVHGTEDPLVPLDNGEALAKLCPDAKFHPIQGAGHMFFSDAVWREIRAALSD